MIVSYFLGLGLFYDIFFYSYFSKYNNNDKFNILNLKFKFEY